VGWAVVAGVAGAAIGAAALYFGWAKETLAGVVAERDRARERALPALPGGMPLPQLPSKPANPASVPGIPGNGGVLVIPPDLSQLIPGLFPKPVNVP